MRFGSLFSGIGGLDLGLERAGMECAWQVEIDEWCRRVLARHWPDVPRWDDAATFPPDAEGTGREARDRHGEGAGVGLEGRQVARLGGFERVDLICGGFPCQPVSLAGKRRGQDDERWLWPEFARIVRLLRPRYVLVENVPGLLARGMGDVLGDLAACGYDTEWDCIPAAAVGAPHLRYRVFIVAHANAPELRLQPAGLAGSGGEAVVADNGSEEPVADAASLGWSRSIFTRPHVVNDGSQPALSHAGDEGDRGWWAVEPNVGRVAHGIPSRVDRLRGLGNAVVPQVAEWIGRRLMETL